MYVILKSLSRNDQTPKGLNGQVFLEDVYKE